MTSRFVRLWADFVVAIGYGIIAVAIVAGAALLIVGLPDRASQLAASPALQWGARVVGAMLFVLVGTLLGGVLIVAGHLVQTFLNQQRTLRGIYHRLQVERPAEPRVERAVADRFRRRL